MTKQQRLGLPSVALIAVPPVWAVGRVIAPNLGVIPHLERLIVLALALMVVEICVAYILVARGLPSLPAALIVSFGLALLVGFGPVMRSWGDSAGWLLFVMLVTVVGVLVSRWRDTVVPQAAAAAFAVALLSGPTMAAIASAGSHGMSSLSPPAAINHEMSDRPNIWLVVLDGYPGEFTLESDFGIGPEIQLTSFLDESGFDTPASSWTAYPSTNLSLPALLDMGYPARNWSSNSATSRALYDIIAGQSQLVNVLNANGYVTHLTETTWSGSYCGREYDQCRSSPIYDSALNIVAFNSIFGSQDFARPGYAFAVGSQSTMSELLRAAGNDQMSGSPNFVFSHVLAPHPPFFLDAACNRRTTEDRGGFFLPYRDVPRSDRVGYFLEQVDCVDSFVEEFVGKVDVGDLVILVSDHGTDLRAQMDMNPEEWDDDAIRERMNVLVAVRSPVACDIGESVLLPNLLRRVLSCYSDDHIADLPEEIHLSPTERLEFDALASTFSR